MLVFFRKCVESGANSGEAVVHRSTGSGAPSTNERSGVLFICESVCNRKVIISCLCRVI
jgi:hypothetical protein